MSPHDWLHDVWFPSLFRFASISTVHVPASTRNGIVTAMCWESLTLTVNEFVWTPLSQDITSRLVSWLPSPHAPMVTFVHPSSSNVMLRGHEE